MEPVTADFSLLAMFAKADPVVKTVMVLLAVASLWSWAVAIEKWFQFGDLNNKAKQFEKLFWSGQSLEGLDEDVGDRPRDSLARVFSAASREWREARRAGALQATQITMVQERCDRLMQAQAQREIARASKGLAVLATIGSSAPFIGLFGTVWGIMNSFTAIGLARETNLAVVAPHISEALFATAMGLAAAIPAVIFYNKFAGDLDRFADRLETFSDEVAARLSRRLSERGG
jgi:biopolymer transport protein TolQ